MALTNHGAQLAAQALFSGGGFIALHSGGPGADGAANEISGSGYVRQPAVFNVANGVASNIGAVVFPTVTGTPYTVGYVTVWDAQNGGNCLMTGALDLAKLMAVNDAMDFEANALNLVLA